MLCVVAWILIPLRAGLSKQCFPGSRRVVWLAFDLRRCLQVANGMDRQPGRLHCQNQVTEKKKQLTLLIPCHLFSLVLSPHRRAKQEKKAVSIGYLGNVVDLWYRPS